MTTHTSNDRRVIEAQYLVRVIEAQYIKVNPLAKGCLQTPIALVRDHLNRHIFKPSNQTKST